MSTVWITLDKNYSTVRGTCWFRQQGGKGQKFEVTLLYVALSSVWYMVSALLSRPVWYCACRHVLCYWHCSKCFSDYLCLYVLLVQAVLLAVYYRCVFHAQPDVQWWIYEWDMTVTKTFHVPEETTWSNFSARKPADGQIHPDRGEETYSDLQKPYLIERGPG